MSRQGNAVEQEELWSNDELHLTIADRCILDFTTRYLNWIEQNPKDKPLSLQAYELSHGCLLICVEYSDKLSRNPSALLTKCREAAYHRGWRGIYDLYPWALALEAANGEIGSDSIAVEGVAHALAHGDSSTRGYMFVMAWFIRKWIPRDSAAPLLLKNVADTLGEWWISLGLCSYLFEKEDEFWAYADAYVVEDDRFEDQYHDRLQLVRNAGLGMCRCDLLGLDSDIRRVIDDYVLGLRCNE